MKFIIFSYDSFNIYRFCGDVISVIPDTDKFSSFLFLNFIYFLKEIAFYLIFSVVFLFHCFSL